MNKVNKKTATQVIEEHNYDAYDIKATARRLGVSTGKGWEADAQAIANRENKS